jgi:hypothetical protein
MQEYVWTMLNISTPWSTKFTSSGAYSWHTVRFSLSGLPKGSDLKVELDGTDLGWVARENIGFDRWHYDVHREYSLSPEEHEVKFTLVNKDREGIAQLCSVEIIEFGNEDEFVLILKFLTYLLNRPLLSRFISTPGYYGIFPTSVLSLTTGLEF